MLQKSDALQHISYSMELAPSDLNFLGRQKSPYFWVNIDEAQPAVSRVVQKPTYGAFFFRNRTTCVQLENVCWTITMNAQNIL